MTLDGESTEPQPGPEAAIDQLTEVAIAPVVHRGLRSPQEDAVCELMQLAQSGNPFACEGLMMVMVLQEDPMVSSLACARLEDLSAADPWDDTRLTAAAKLAEGLRERGI